jgi:MFS family permease
MQKPAMEEIQVNYTYRLKQNVWKNYLFVFLMSFDLTQGTWMIYLGMKGMTLFQLGLLEGIFHMTSFLMEVPTGAIADIWGRKASRILGRVLSVVYIAMLVFSDSFYMFALSFIICALSYNLESGAGEALVYDSLMQTGDEKSYIKLAGIQELAMQAGRMTAYLLGGYLASLAYEYAYGTALVVSTAAAIQSLTFVEPMQEEKGIGLKGLRIVKHQVAGSLKVISGNRRIGFLIVFMETTFLFATTIFYYMQNYLKGRGYNEGRIGLVLAVASLLAAITASQTHRIERVMGERGILMIMPLLTAISIWGISFSIYPNLYFTSLLCAEGITAVALGDYINKIIPSDKRATILSFGSMVFSSLMIVVFPLVGKIGDEFSLEVSFRFLAIMATVLGLTNIYILTKGNRIKNFFMVKFK